MHLFIKIFRPQSHMGTLWDWQVAEICTLELDETLLNTPVQQFQLTGVVWCLFAEALWDFSLCSK